MQTTQSGRRKTVIVTGAGSGIGYAVAERFAREGYNVVLSGRDESKLDAAARRLGDAERLAIHAGDVSLEQTGIALRELALGRFGGVDTLVNNAGIFGSKPFLESRREDVMAFLSTNLFGTYLTTQAVVPSMIERGGGAVVNIGTVLVDQAMSALPTAAAMTAKGGIHALSVSLAAELAAHKVRVNVVAPGIVRTPLIGPDADAHAAIHPLGRIAEAHEIAHAVFFVASAEFVTGIVLPVDGGYSHGR